MIIPVAISGSTLTASGFFPFANGQQISVDSRIENQVPAPLLEFDSQGKRVFYYIVNATGNSFQVAATVAGSPIILTTGGIGQITVSEFPPLTWQQVVDLPIAGPSDIRARWLTPESMLNLSAAPDTPIGCSVASSVFTSGIPHGLDDWTAVRFASDGALPSPLTSGATYYVLNTTETLFAVASVIGGSALTITGGSGQLTVRNWGLNDLLEAKGTIGWQWLYDALLEMVTNHIKGVGRSWWWWMNPPTEQMNTAFYPTINKAQIVLDNLRNPEKLIEAWRDFTKWAMIEDGTFRNQIKDPTFFQEFGSVSSGQTMESVAKKRAEQRLAQQAQLLQVSGHQGAHRIFDFGETTDSISISLI